MLVQLSVFVIALSSCLELTLGQSNYCKISKDHTMCKFPGVARICGKPVARGLTATERDSIVSIHNKLRAKVANGQESRGRGGPQPSAANMMELVWDNELESVAQRWADQCQFGHDSNRNVDRFSVGQNVFLASTTQIGPVNWNQAINAFYDEVALFDKNVVGKYSFSAATGHYTQLVWAATKVIGCGSIQYKKGNFINKYIVCNYGPAGNFIGSPMYTKGPACSKCPSGTSCSSRNRGLCAASGRKGMSEGESEDPMFSTESPVPRESDMLEFSTMETIPESADVTTDQPDVPVHPLFLFQQEPSQTTGSPSEIP